MDSGTLTKFIQSVGVSDYSKTKRLATIRNRSELIGELLKDSGVTKNYNRTSDLEKAMQNAGIYYKF